MCWKHGGAAPQVREAARRRLEKIRLEGEVAALLEELGEPVDVDPLDTLVRAVGRAHRMAALLEVLVGGLGPHPTDEAGEPTAGLYGPDHLGDARAHPLVDLLAHWNDQAARTSRLALAAGVAERRVQIQTEAAHAVVQVLRGATAAVFDLLAAANVDRRLLSRIQTVELPGIMRRELEAAATDSRPLHNAS